MFEMTKIRIEFWRAGRVSLWHVILPPGSPFDMLLFNIGHWIRFHIFRQRTVQVPTEMDLEILRQIAELNPIREIARVRTEGSDESE